MEDHLAGTVLANELEIVSGADVQLGYQRVVDRLGDGRKVCVRLSARQCDVDK
jgi:hypothetical protein